VDPSRLGKTANAVTTSAWSGRLPAQQAALSVPIAAAADPGDLVARALTILAEETEAWHARRGANALPGQSR
jgi:hypothetical protein